MNSSVFNQNKASQKDYIFIVGHPRSGSTLLASRLNQHSSLLALPETHFFSTSCSGTFLARFLSKLSSKNMFKFVYTDNIRMQDISLDAINLRKLFIHKNITNLRSAFELITSELLKCTSKSKVVEKTPTHIEHIKNIIAWYPQCKIIVIIRDFRDAVDSLSSAPWVHSNEYRHAAYWGWCVRQGLKWKSMFPNNILIIRYEDLLQDQHSTFSTIFDFSEIDIEFSILDGVAQQNTVPGWEAQWKANSLGEIDSKLAYKWKNKIQSYDRYRYLEKFVSRELVALEYDKLNYKQPSFTINEIPYIPFVYNLLFGLNILRRKYFMPRTHKYRKSQK